MSDLRQRMQVELAVRGLAADTQHAYLRSVQELAAYYNLPVGSQHIVDITSVKTDH